jgi:hypothetical protein
MAADQLRRLMQEGRFRCEAANVPLFQSLFEQSLRENPKDAAAVSDSIGRVFSGTLAAVCEQVRRHPNEAVRAAFPACASESSQKATCAAWFSSARCEGTANRDFAAANPQLCVAAVGMSTGV